MRISLDKMSKTRSRQTNYQRTHKVMGLCWLCPLPISPGSSHLCIKHAIAKRESVRKKNKAKKRYYNAASYKLES